MSVMVPSQEQLAIWAAEEAWDWHVRVLFAIVCACALAVVLVIYLRWGRGDGEGQDGRARRYIGRVAVTLFVVAAFSGSFFKDIVSILMLVASGFVAGVIALSLSDAQDESAEQADLTIEDEEIANEQPVRG